METETNNHKATGPFQTAEGTTRDNASSAKCHDNHGTLVSYCPHHYPFIYAKRSAKHRAGQ